MRLLLVENDREAAEGLAKDLCRHGFETDTVDRGEQVLGPRADVDLVLLGLELPDLDGVEVCRRLRERSAVPVIGLSWRDSELDRVLGLQAGMDDYIVKPFRLPELLARIDAVMRRVHPGAPVPEPIRGERPDKVIERGPLVIDLAGREVWLRGRPITLTRKEFDLLALLAAEPGAVLSRSRIMSRVWQDDSSLPSRTIDTHIGTLRGKLGARSWIVTVHGVGFRFGDAG